MSHQLIPKIFCGGAFFAAVMTLVPVGVLAGPPTSTSNTFTLLPAEPGAGGGHFSSATFSGESSTGDGVTGGVSDVTGGGVQAKEGYTGQLYDPLSLELSADPGTGVNEGDGVQLSGEATLDDDTTLETTELIWSVEGGPATIDTGGLAIAGTITANATATIKGSLDGISDTLGLSILNLPFEGHPLVWQDQEPGGDGPYLVYFGTTAGTLPLVATPEARFFNPGRLNMGTTYFFRIEDDSGDDITPGGPGPQSFTTSLFKPDTRIGPKVNPGTHRGNNIYNLTGGGQLARLNLKGRRKGKLHFSVENDGDTADDPIVQGTRANRKFKFVKYFRLSKGRANITAEVIKAGFTQADVNPGTVVAFQIQAKSNGRTRSAQSLKIRTSSAKDARAADLAKGRLKGRVK